MYRRLNSLRASSSSATVAKCRTQSKFSFSVPGTTETYRVVVAYEPGYYEYGYSNSVKLTAT